MRHSNQERFRQQVQFLRRQFLQDGDLPFIDVLTEAAISQALATITGWLDRIFSPLVTLWVFLSQVLLGRLFRVQQRRHHHDRPGPEPRLGDPDPRLPNGDELGQRMVRFPVQRPDRRRLAPLDDVVLSAEPLATAKVGLPVRFVEAADESQAALLEHHQVRPIAQQRIGQEDVPRTQAVPQPAE